MQDSLGQTARVGDFIVCTDYSQTGMYYGIVTKNNSNKYSIRKS